MAVTTQIKETCILNGVEEFVWSITTYGAGEYYEDKPATSLKLDSGRVHILKEGDTFDCPWLRKGYF